MTLIKRIRAAKIGNGQRPPALATRLSDLASKWLKGCGSLQELVDAVRVWVSERKPATSAETGRLAEKYLQAGGSRRVGAGLKPERPSGVQWGSYFRCPFPIFAARILLVLERANSSTVNIKTASLC